jgi:hypothetical protein
MMLNFKKKYDDRKKIFFIIYREQVYQFFRRIEQVDNMEVYFSIYEHYQSIPSIEIKAKSLMKNLIIKYFTFGKLISFLGKSFADSCKSFSINVSMIGGCSVNLIDS